MATRLPQPWFVRPLGALLILLVEYLIITLSFDAAPLLEQVGLWTGLGWMGLVGPGLIAFLTAVWILAGDSLREALRRSSGSRTGRLAWPSLVLHLLSFAAFYVLTARVFDAPGEEALSPLWIVLWVITGSAALLTLIPVAFAGLRATVSWRDLFVPVSLAVLLSFVAWAAGLATLLLWDRLSDATLYAVALILGTLIEPIYFEPSEAAIGTEYFWIRVAPVCSGYEGIGLILVFLSAFLVAFRKRFRFPRVLVLIPLAIAAVWLLNVVRIVALILLGHIWSPELALGGFHSKAGWLLFCGVALGTVWLSGRIPWFAREPSDPRAKITNPSAPFLLPLLVLVATALLTGLFTETFDYLYPIRVVAVLLVLAWYRDEYTSGFRAQLQSRPVLSWAPIAIGVLVYLIWIGTVFLFGAHETRPAPEELMAMSAPLRVTWLIARVFGAVVTVPIVEELAFRGFLLRRIIGARFTQVPYEKWSWPAVLLSSLAFAALHQQWLGGFAAGLLFAYAQKRRGLLSDAIVAHAVSNALIAIQVLAGGYWSLW